MKTNKSRALFLIAIMAVPAIAFASGGGEGGETHADPMAIVWQFVNFGILIAVLVIFGKKPIRDALNDRREAIRKSLDEAREARSLAEKALKEVRASVSGRDAQVAEIIRAARTSGEQERAQLIAEGERMRDAIVEQARRNIDFELAQAREAIKREAAALALELAEQKLAGRVADADRKRLFEEALGSLEGSAK